MSFLHSIVLFIFILFNCFWGKFENILNILPCDLEFKSCHSHWPECAVQKAHILERLIPSTDARAVWCIVCCRQLQQQQQAELEVHQRDGLTAYDLSQVTQENFSKFSIFSGFFFQVFKFFSLTV